MRAVLAKLDRLEEQAERLARVVMLAIVLRLAGCPPWAERVDDGTCVRFIGGDRTTRRKALTRLQRGLSLEAGAVELRAAEGASRFIAEVVDGTAFEVACWGARGDRKTTAALLAIPLLSDLHREAGGALPFRVMVPTGTFTEHELKLCRTLQAPHWGGCWSLREDKHLGVLTVAGVELAQLDLFGAGDVNGPDRLRMEAHVLWCEEVAAAALEGTGGVTADAWGLALTSVRLPTRRPVALLTSNLPDEDHWAWERFEGAPAPGTASVRIRAGESASAEDRARWAVALQDRPDLLQRLLAGEPGAVVQGPQVAKGYNALTHVAPAPLEIPRYSELWCGWDSAPNGHTHAVTIGQRHAGEVRVYACLIGEQTGLQQHLEAVLAWFARRAAWALEPGGRERLHHRCDPAMEPAEGGDAEHDNIRRVRRALGGHVHPVPRPDSWPARSGPMLGLLNRGNGRGGMALQLCPSDDTATLRKALGGRWHYAVTRAGVVVRDLPAKPDHPWEDAGDSFLYLIGGLAPSGREGSGRRPEVKNAFNVFTVGRPSAEPITRRIPWQP